MSLSVSALRDLIAKWRKEADGQGAIYASGIYDCAEDLQALLDAHPPQPDQFAEDSKTLPPGVKSNAL